MCENNIKSERSRKAVDESRTEQVHIILPMDVNASFSLFGGKLMEWIDIVAAVVARRHSGQQVTTVAVDHLEFLAPAKLNDMVVLNGRMTYTGRTSMEVCVETYVETVENGGERKLINRAYLTMVALDRNLRPTEVPMLSLCTTEEQADFERAQKRVERRKKAKND